MKREAKRDGITYCIHYNSSIEELHNRSIDDRYSIITGWLHCLAYASADMPSFYSNQQK